MKIEQNFTVTQNAGTVWNFFQDVPAVAQCLPGAELTEDKGEGVYGGKLSIKLGPMSANFEGEATVTPHPEEKSATISGKGVDRRGGSRGQVTVVYRISEHPEGTEVKIEAEVQLAGAAAQFGRTGLINEMSARLIGEFSDCLHRKLQATTVEEAAQIEAGEVKGIRLFFASLWSWFKRLGRKSRS